MRGPNALSVQRTATAILSIGKIICNPGILNMARVIALHSVPRNVVEYDHYYYENHVPLVKAMPGLRRYEVNRGDVTVMGLGAPVHLIAIMHFDDLDSVRAAIASPEGKAATEDLSNFVENEGDVTIMYFEDDVI
jgi:uncharacterized protein (TIGR02118 family)